jgi:hypothetical protein
MKSPIVLLGAFLNDIRRLQSDVKGLDRDYLTIKNRFENEGYGFLTIALPMLCDSLDRGLATRQFACPIGFKSPKGKTIPAFLQGMFCEVFDPVTGHLKHNPSTHVVKLLRELLRMFKKMKMPDSTTILLEKKAVSSFFENDEIAKSVFIPDRESHVLGTVCSFVLPDLNFKDLENATYKHGPGAVYEGCIGNQKWSSMIDAIKSDSFDVEAYGYDAFSVILSDLSERTEIIQSKTPLAFVDGASRRFAKLISVAKNSTSRRTITIEPLSNQFIQQGLNIVLRDSILKCPILRNCLALTDQSLNQKLALEGSLTDKWATIDLKSASDLLSVKLVEIVFGRHDRFFGHMMACRSPSVTYKGNTLMSLGKFAGMGNALTFPVQSICFALVCIAAIHDFQFPDRKPNYWSVKRASRHIRVYGDDIIIDTRYVHQCVNWLTMVGLKVNHGKSFLEGNFKESCGLDAFMGVDVTPVYVKDQPDHPSKEPSVIAGLVSASNQFWFRGLYEASTCLKNEVEERLGYSLPLVSSKSGSLGWHTHLDCMTPHRWNRTLHRLETRAPVLTPAKIRDRLDGYAALLKFFHVPLLGRAKDHLKQTSKRFHNRLVWKWVPTNVG